MLKHLCAVVVAAWLLSTAVWGQDNREGYGNVQVALNGGDNVAYIGETNTVEFWIENDATLEGMGLGFEFTIQVAFQFDSNYGGSGLYVQEHGRAIGAFDMLTGLLENAAMDDLSPDSLLFGGATLPGYGLPAGPLELCYTMEFDLLPDQAEVTGGFTIDNIFMPPGGNWSFIDASGSYPPDYQDNPNSSHTNPDAPAVVFDIVLRPSIPPEITNCPVEPLYLSHGDMLYYTFDAFDPDGDLPLTWELVAGVGEINANTGEYSYDPTDPEVFPTTVRVTDSRGAYVECSFDIVVTNQAPVISNCEGYFLITEYCVMFERQFEVIDPDPGELLAWEVISGEGTINLATGMYTLDPQPHVNSVLPVVVRITDQWGEYDECWFDIEVLNLPPEFTGSCTDTTAGVPGSEIEYQFQAVNYDLCYPLNFMLVSAFPSPTGFVTVDPATGLLYYEPDEADVGITFEFAVSVSDGDEEDTCLVWVDVLLGDNCANPIIIDSLPFIYVGNTANYTNFMQPNECQCGVCDPEFGIGSDIFFHYTALESDTLLLQASPTEEWDAVVYALSACDVDSCLVGADDGGPLVYEVVELAVTAGEDYYIVFDRNDAGNLGGTGIFEVTSEKDTICSKIDPFELTPTDSSFISEGLEVGGIARARVRIITPPDKDCQKRAEVLPAKNSDPARIVLARVNRLKLRENPEMGYAIASVTVSGSYTVQGKYGGDPGKCVFCTLSEFSISARQWAKNKPSVDPGSAYSIFWLERIIEPFIDTLTRYHLPNISSGVLSVDDSSPADSHSQVTREKVAPPCTTRVPFNMEHEIEISFSATAMAQRNAVATASCKEYKFTIVCTDDPDGDKESETESYPVEVNIVSVRTTPVFESRDSEISVAPDFAWSFIPVDNVYDNGGIAFSNLPSFGSQLFFTNRTNGYESADTTDTLNMWPPDTSALFTLSGGAVYPFSTSDIFLAPSDILFDTLGHFGNRLFVAQVDSCDSSGIPEIGHGSVISIDELGNLDTLTNGLDSPVGLAFTSGAPFGDGLYVVEVEAGQMTVIDPGGSAATFVGDLKAPVDLVVGTGGFGDYFYVAEYDTAVTTPVSSPNSGKVVRIDAGGVVTTFADALQAPADLEFGPGGVFGTDLYVLLDNEYNDSTAYEPNTGKIVTIDPSGTVTDFATGLSSPDYLTFDNSGVLYVSVSGGILRIAPYICGDANADGTANITDAVYLINYIFGGGPEPNPYVSGDVNCDGTVNITDAVYLINYIFGGGPPPGDPDDDGVPDC